MSQFLKRLVNGLAAMCAGRRRGKRAPVKTQTVVSATPHEATSSLATPPSDGPLPATVCDSYHSQPAALPSNSRDGSHPISPAYPPSHLHQRTILVVFQELGYSPPSTPPEYSEETVTMSWCCQEQPFSSVHDTLSGPSTSDRSLMFPMDGESHSGVRNQATADMDESASICSDGSCDSRCSMIAIYSKDDDNDYDEEEVKENGLNNDPSSPVPARQPAALHHKESDQYSDSDNDDRDWFFRYWATARLEDFRPSRATRVRRS